MALKQDTTYCGMTITGAYLKVVSPTLSRDNTSIEFGLEFRAAADYEPFNAVTYTAPYDLEGDNPIKQAYAYISGLPEYASAVEA